MDSLSALCYQNFGTKNKHIKNTKIGQERVARAFPQVSPLFDPDYTVFFSLRSSLYHLLLRYRSLQWVPTLLQIIIHIPDQVLVWYIHHIMV